jgi:hypothetical protein
MMVAERFILSSIALTTYEWRGSASYLNYCAKKKSYSLPSRIVLRM